MDIWLAKESDIADLDVETAVKAKYYVLITDSLNDEIMEFIEATSIDAVRQCITSYLGHEYTIRIYLGTSVLLQTDVNRLLMVDPFDQSKTTIAGSDNELASSPTTIVSLKDIK